MEGFPRGRMCALWRLGAAITHTFGRSNLLREAMSAKSGAIPTDLGRKWPSLGCSRPLSRDAGQCGGDVAPFQTHAGPISTMSWAGKTPSISVEFHDSRAVWADARDVIPGPGPAMRQICPHGTWNTSHPPRRLAQRGRVRSLAKRRANIHPKMGPRARTRTTLRFLADVRTTSASHFWVRRAEQSKFGRTRLQDSARL